jgi:hypothetical protein
MYEASFGATFGEHACDQDQDEQHGYPVWSAHLRDPQVCETVFAYSLR